MTSAVLTEDSVRTARGRLDAFTQALPRETLQAEDGLPDVIASLNAAPRTKLRRIYAVADAISEVRAPFWACAAGCSSCCRINVQISRLEADQLANATGRPARRLTSSVPRAPNEFHGRACPFLKGSTCSVYEHRPLACRLHASHFESNAACEPEHAGRDDFPMVSFSGLTRALVLASEQRGDAVFADIRDFFPSIEGAA